MEEIQAPESPDTFTIDQNRIPAWLVFVYLSLLVWTVWNLIRYWD